MWLLLSLLAALPPGFVALRDVVPGIRLDIRYHGKDNFTGEPLPGYAKPDAWMLAEPAQALRRVQDKLNKEGLGLYVYDAYRPLRATLAMVKWAERTGNVALLDGGYVARRSGHNHGHTIDLTLCDANTGKPLDMGTPWDTLTTDSHTKNAKGQALKNRLKLKEAMEAEGFKAYFREWWHFGYSVPGSKAFDVPYE